MALNTSNSNAVTDSICQECNDPLQYDASFFTWRHRFPSDCRSITPIPGSVHPALNVDHRAKPCAHCQMQVCPTTWFDNCAFCGYKILGEHGSFETMDLGPITAFEEGYNAGSNGWHYSQSPNVYLPSGCKYDGADSMGAALAWYEGWKRARYQAGLTTSDYCQGPSTRKKVLSTEGLDYLESQRG